MTASSVTPKKGLFDSEGSGASGATEPVTPEEAQKVLDEANFNSPFRSAKKKMGSAEARRTNAKKASPGSGLTRSNGSNGIKNAGRKETPVKEEFPELAEDSPFRRTDTKSMPKPTESKDVSTAAHENKAADFEKSDTKRPMTPQTPDGRSSPNTSYTGKAFNGFRVKVSPGTSSSEDEDPEFEDVDDNDADDKDDRDEEI